MQIFSLDTKKSMNELLRTASFDHFLFIEGEIVTFNTFHIDGYLKKAFYRQIGDSEQEVPDRSYALWKEQRDFCFSLIKGKRAPLSFRFVLSLSTPNIAYFLSQNQLAFSPQEVQGLYLNFSYDGQALTCTTGTSLNIFTMDKSIDSLWDKMAAKIFTKHEIPFEIME